MPPAKGLVDYVADAAGVDGIVTNAITVFSWIGSDGLEHGAIIRDGSPIAIYGLLHLGIEVFQENMTGMEEM